METASISSPGIFCEILAGHAEGSVVFWDGLCAVLADTQPVNDGHLLVIPRFERDGFGFRFAPDYGRLPPREELDRVAGEVRRHLEG